MSFAIFRYLNIILFFLSQIKLADKQAAVEKLQWEAKTSNQKVERLQAELDSMRSQISSMMHIFEGLSQELDDAVIFVDDYDVTSFYTDHLPNLVCLVSPSSVHLIQRMCFMSLLDPYAYLV